MAYKKYPNSKQFSKGLSNGLKSQLYCFLGEEEGDKDKIISQMIDIHLAGIESPEQYSERYILSKEKSSWEDFIKGVEYALSSSMFAEKKVAIFKNADKIQNSKEASNLFRELFEEIPQETLVILTVTGNSLPASISKLFPKEGEIIQFWKYFANDLLNYIREKLKERGITAEYEAINEIIKLTGNDIKKVDDAIEMITFSNIQEHIDSNLVKKIVGDTKEITIFEFIDHLFAGNRTSLSYLTKLLNEGMDELFILNMIARQTNLIEKYYILINEQTPHDEALKRIGLGYSKPRKEKFKLCLRNIKDYHLAKIYPAIARAEYQLKSGSHRETHLTAPIFELSRNIAFINQKAPQK